MTMRIDSALISAVKYFRPKRTVQDDSPYSAIHYKLTFGVLLACSILTGFTSWYSPIECTKPDDKSVEAGLVKQWCYANSTFIVEGASEGLYPHIGNAYTNPRRKIVRITYYQWVTFCLLLQAASFQVPRILWKFIEGGRVRKLVDHLLPLDLESEDQRITRCRELGQYFLARRDQNRHFFLCFALCQLLYFVNVVLQIIITNMFLRGCFVTLFPRWLAVGMPELDRVFPKMVKCEFRIFGFTGTPTMNNVLCLLAMNVLNEKLYLLLWLLLLSVFLVSIVQLVSVGITLSLLSFQIKRLDEKVEKELDALNLNADDVVMLNLIKDSVDVIVFQDFIVYGLLGEAIKL